MGWVRFLAGCALLALIPFVLISIMRGEWMLVVSYAIAFLIGAIVLIALSPDDDFQSSTRGPRFIKLRKKRGHR